MKCLRLLLLLICAMVSTSASCENSDKEVDTEDFSWSKYLSIDVLRCERVGHVLQIDFKLTNKTDDDVEIGINHPKVIGDDGTEYNYISHTLGNNYYYAWDIETVNRSLTPKQSVVYHIKVSDFSYPTSLKSVDIDFYFGQYGTGLYQKKAINVTDNRVLSNGVQTNDVNLNYQVQSCRVDKKGDLILDFVLTNNTGVDIENMSLTAEGARIQDNNGTTDYRWSYRWGTNSWTGWGGVFVDIPNRGQAKGSFCIENFNKSATSISIFIPCSPDNYPVADKIVRFITIPVQK